MRADRIRGALRNDGRGSFILQQRRGIEMRNYKNTGALQPDRSTSTSTDWEEEKRRSMSRKHGNVGGEVEDDVVVQHRKVKPLVMSYAICGLCIARAWTKVMRTSCCAAGWPVRVIGGVARWGLALLNVVPSAKSLQRHGRRLEQPEPASPSNCNALTPCHSPPNAVNKALVWLLHVFETSSFFSTTIVQCLRRVVLHVALRVACLGSRCPRIAPRWPRLVPTTFSLLRPLDSRA